MHQPSRRFPWVLPAAALTITVLALAALAPAAGAQAAPTLRPCPGQGQFGCGTLNVPLDYSGAVAGSIPLHFAAQRRFPGGAKKILFALTGGPGQQGVDFASSSELTLAPALRQYRLVTLDQRGTGKSGVLRCPQLQALLTLDDTLPDQVAACAGRIGPRRAFYTSSDTVLDLESLRKALGATKVAIMGISYGTHVGLQYARAFPQNVDRLILDSVVGPGDPDPLSLDSFGNLPRILREQCANSRCRGVTADPVADLAALITGMNTKGPLRGSFFDDRGRRRATVYHKPDELFFLLVAGDLNPLLRAALPGAIAAARRGDTGELMRLRRIGQGSRTPTTDLSAGLFVTTDCLDSPLPYPLATTPVAARPPVAQAAISAVPSARYAPFDPATVLRSSSALACLDWPNDVARAPFSGPLPDVPTLLLGGRLDMRTPIENARATAALLPHSKVVALPGNGHDAIDTDLTGCIDRAFRRFIDNLAVGDPCRGRNNGFQPLPQPPRSLDDFRSAPGVGGVRGRALFAALDSVNDAIITSEQLQDAQLPQRGGGLRGGHFRVFDQGAALDLTRYAYVPGFRVTGTVRAGNNGNTGRLRVEGPKGTSGVVRITRTGATGRLGGRSFTYRAPRATGAAVGAASVGAARAAAGAHRVGVAQEPAVSLAGARRLGARRAQP